MGRGERERKGEARAARGRFGEKENSIDAKKRTVRPLVVLVVAVAVDVLADELAERALLEERDAVVFVFLRRAREQPAAASTAAATARATRRGARRETAPDSTTRRRRGDRASSAPPRSRVVHGTSRHMDERERDATWTTRGRRVCAASSRSDPPHSTAKAHSQQVAVDECARPVAPLLQVAHGRAGLDPLAEAHGGLLFWVDSISFFLPHDTERWGLERRYIVPIWCWRWRVCCGCVLREQRRARSLLASAKLGVGVAASSSSASLGEPIVPISESLSRPTEIGPRVPIPQSHHDRTIVLTALASFHNHARNQTFFKGGVCPSSRALVTGTRPAQ